MAKATTHYTRGMSWQELTEFPGKAQVKMLRDERPAGPTTMTMLVSLPPGGHIDPHAHVAPVQHYILDGECESEGQVYLGVCPRIGPAR